VTGLVAFSDMFIQLRFVVVSDLAESIKVKVKGRLEFGLK
jgi:hypothetical protein